MLTNDNTENISETLRTRMLEQLVSDGSIRSRRLFQAFLKTPREIFVPSFLKEERNTSTGQTEWRTVSPQTLGFAEYLHQVYTDTSLVVQTDERGWPCSSSSMPTVMALMLEALTIHPGTKVLEIGTSTGYNAAIIAHLTEDAKLATSIDRDHACELAMQAEKALHEHVGPVLVKIGDGFNGVPAYAPYDRILATASAPTLPLPWFEQLAPGGRLVMDLQGPLASGFLVLDKLCDGSGRGYFEDRPLYFMPLVSPHVPSIFVNTRFTLLTKQPRRNFFPLDGLIFPAILQDQNFRWFLQWYAPGCNIVDANFGEEHNIFFVDTPHQSILRLRETAQQWVGEAFGSRPLWDILQNAFKQFVDLDCPSPSEYRMEIDVHGHAAMLIGTLRLPIS
jgi:protein-L-isoaspartate(D-aspartate) O-methyltransferase